MTKGPVRLQKQVKDTNHGDILNLVMNRLEALALRHATLLFIVAISLLIALFVTIIFMMVGVSAVDSGAMRNFVNGGYV